MTRASCLNSCCTSLYEPGIFDRCAALRVRSVSNNLELLGPCIMADLRTTANILRRALSLQNEGTTIAQRPDYFGLLVRRVIDAIFSCFFRGSLLRSCEVVSERSSLTTSAYNDRTDNDKDSLQHSLAARRNIALFLCVYPKTEGKTLPPSISRKLRQRWGCQPFCGRVGARKRTSRR